MVIPCLLWKWGRACAPAPEWRYLPLPQVPSAKRWDHHERPFLWFWRICTPCLLHQPSGCPAPCMGGCAGACTLSHSDACSTCALTLAKSTPRKVTSTSCPCRVAFRVMLTGASGRGAGTVGGCAVSGKGVAARSSRTRLSMPAAIVGRDRARYLPVRFRHPPR